jgi:hypothetical protein
MPMPLDFHKLTNNVGGGDASLRESGRERKRKQKWKKRKNEQRTHTLVVAWEWLGGTFGALRE